jgi:hypothetical protein
VENYKLLNEALIANNIASHASYILGFPDDTESSIKEDIKKLIDIGFCQASFFIMTPLPGSVDHKRLVEQGIPMDPDYNNFDSFGPVMPHPHMSAEKLVEMYQYAWHTFQDPANVKKIFSNKFTPDHYYKLFGNFIWYKHAIQVDKNHPMVSGFARVRDRKQRRPGYTQESFLAFHGKRLKAVPGTIKKYVHLIREMEEIWLQTRPRSELEKKVVGELIKLQAGIRDRIHFADLLKAFKQARLKAPSRLRYYLGKVIFPVNRKFTYTRVYLNHFWSQAKTKFKKGKLLQVNFIKIILNFLYEIKLLLAILTRFLMIKIKRAMPVAGNLK